MLRLGSCLSLLILGVAASCFGTDLSAQAPKEKTIPMPPNKLRIEGNVLTIRAHGDHQVYCLAFSPDGKRLASGGGDETMKVWDAATGQQVFSKNQNGIFSSVAYSPDGKRLVSTSGVARQPVKIWDSATGAEVLSLDVSGVTGSVAFNSDGKLLAVGGSIFGQKQGEGPVSGQVKIWDAATGKPVLTRDLPNHFVTSISFSPDGKSVAIGTGEARVPDWRGEVMIWDVATGREIRTIKGQAKGAGSVAYGPDGKLLPALYMGTDGGLKLSDLATGKEALAFKGHTGSVNSVAFSPNGKWLASASLDETVRVWDTATGRELLCLRHPGEKSGRYMYSVTFSPDGKRLAAGDRDGRVEVWKLSE